MKAVDSVDSCIGVLEKYRNDNTFDELFDRVEESTGQSIARPRQAGRQRHRSNPPVGTAREHYRVAVFLQFLDVCLSQLRERFRPHRCRGQNMSALLPSVSVNRDFDSLSDAVALYVHFLDCDVDVVDAEFQLWRQHWLGREEHERPNIVFLKS